MDFKNVIYANQMLRAAYPAMVNTAKIFKKTKELIILKKYKFSNEIINLIK